MNYNFKMSFLVLLSMAITACSEGEPTPPSVETVRWALEPPLLNSLSYRGFDLPREAVRMKGMDILITSFSVTDGVKRVSATGGFTVELTADGGEIQLMIMGDGDLASLMAAQPFVRAGGNLLRAGQQIEYTFNADLVETEEGVWRVARGNTQAR